MAGWNDSSRLAGLPPNWSELRREAKRLAHGKCQWQRKNGSRCAAWGTDCDHIGENADHRQVNLRWLCRAHHNLHTQQQSKTAVAAKKLKRFNSFYSDHPGTIR